MTDHREEDLEERRRRLTTELAERDAKVKDEERAEINADQTRKGYGMAMKISSEFISAIIVVPSWVIFSTTLWARGHGA